MNRITKGFTLIEHMVVIAIIAIVAAILFPVFAQAKGAAKKASAMSNLDQIGKAEHMYFGDNDDTLPFRYQTMTKWPGYNIILFMAGQTDTLDKVYSPYIKNRDVWYSPEDRLPKKGPSSYAFNGQLSYAWSLSQIARPAEAIYLMDRTDINYFGSGEQTNDLYSWWMFTQDPIFSESQLPGVLDPIQVTAQVSPNRYTGKVALYQFLDSHVKAMKFDQTWGNDKTNLHLGLKP